MRTLNKIFKLDKEKFKIPRCVQDIIPIKAIWEDGIFQVSKNKFSKSFKFMDINYAVASKEDKEAMFLDYSDLLNSLDVGAITKITINNRRINKLDFEKTILLKDSGDELDKYLTNYGFKVIHNKTYHDYPAYTGSYGRSLTTVSNLLSQTPNTDILIDLHRDAIGDESFAPKVKIGEEYAAQIMFVIGTDGSGLEHPNWKHNLEYAIKLQKKANEMYPGLFKAILVTNARYNQHLSSDCTIMEFGATRKYA